MSPIFLQFIVACFAVFLVYIVVNAFSAKRTVERGSWDWRNWLLIAILALIVATRRDLAWSAILNLRLWPQTFVFGVTADLVILLGLAIVLWARLTLGRNWSANVVLKEDHELIARGPYAYVRHPMYSGLLCMILGAMILYGSPGAVILWGAFLVAFWLKAIQEEQLLARHFPREYPEYKRHTKALIPFILVLQAWWL